MSCQLLSHLLLLRGSLKLLFDQSDIIRRKVIKLKRATAQLAKSTDDSGRCMYVCLPVAPL